MLYKPVPWLSILLLLLANIAFGFFLHEYVKESWLWGAAIAYIVAQCGILSIVWQPVRNFLLLGFQSDVGYAFMALAGASFAVVIVVWARVSSYFLVMLAAALLMRIELFTRRLGRWLSFLAMVLVSLVGLAITWLPGLSQFGRF